MEYTKCINCGKYLKIIDAKKKYFCSFECLCKYSTCIICGKYFLKTQGYSNDICSRDCSVTYKITKRNKSDES